MRNEPTYAQIASDWNLWADYADPEATMTESEFEAMSVEEKIAIQIECFGNEEMEEMQGQFEAMDYTVTCNTCGQRITDVLLSKDFSPRMRDMGDSIVAHNMTHYVRPS